MTGSGLTATELAAVLLEIAPILAAATIRDVARIEGKDDLLLFLEHPDGGRALHIVPGGRRARVTLTTRRFRQDEFRSGPLIDRLRQTLRGATIEEAEMIPGERRCTLRLRDEDGVARSLEVELFGARGLWCLVDGAGKIRELSRLPDSAGRELRPGAIYAPPPPRENPVSDTPPRFDPPMAAAIDDAFTKFDRDHEVETLRTRLAGILDRAARRLGHKIEGLSRQHEEIGRIDEIRRQADMLLAYGFGAPPGATELEVPDLDDPAETLTLPIDPRQPIQSQVDKLYKKARKLQDGRAIAAERKAQAEAALVPVTECRARFDECTTLDELFEIQDRLADLGLLPAPRRGKPAPPSAKERQIQKITKGFNFRRFTSSEGHLILVGRSNHENDRLSIAVARGNDLWFHVGQGYAGSHVVMRLPKEKTASLDSLLDAGTLALHFSKARNADRCEILYTLAKNVRKPKGLPPGKVTTTNTKTIVVDREADRLRRLLDSTESS